MTPGDIIPMPSGRPAKYLGGNGHGAEFVYLDANGEPVWDSHHQTHDTVVISSTRLLAKLQPEVA